MRVLVTGAAGFAGSHIVEELLGQPGNEVVVLDCLTYAGNLNRLSHLPLDRIKIVHHDFRFPLPDSVLQDIGKIDFIIHNGAESHVARSFQNPRIFVESNVVGTLNMLQAARKLKPEKFIYVSTDEVFGPSHGALYSEEDVLQPTNPYAATKAAGELLAQAHMRTLGVPTIITRTMNMFGERQHPEKFVPMAIAQLLRNETVKVHGIRNRDTWQSGTRYWLHARAQANALVFLLQYGVPGQKYNIPGTHKSNLDVLGLIACYLGLKACPWEWAEPDAPTHDLDYALDGTKMRTMGWKNPCDFEDSLKQTVQWTAQHTEWLKV